MPDSTLLNLPRAKGAHSSTADQQHPTRCALPLYASAATLLLLIDLFTVRFNPSILYTALLVVAFGSRWLVSRISPLQAAIILVLLTYAGYFLGAGASTDWKTVLISYRFANRTFAAAALLTIAGLFEAVRQWKNGRR